MTEEVNKLISSFWQGFAAGCGTVHFISPVAYLYNGVRLPKLPEWDREKYPYAVIYEKPAAGGNARYYAFAACKTPIAFHYFNVGIGGTTETLTCSDDTAGYVQCILNRSDSAWDENWNSMTENTTQVFGSGVSPVLVWANHDVNYDDSSRPVELAGTLYLVKSEPVPVYE